MTTDPPPPPTPQTAERWLAEHADAMHAYAAARLARREDAEDAVQESLLNALKNLSSFDNRSSERTWLIGILRHKVLDTIRRRAREDAYRADLRAQLETADPAFAPDHQFAARQRPWPISPANAPEREEILTKIEQAIRFLPDSQRQVLYLSEIDAVPSKEICTILDISQANLWTLLHRARTSIRKHLDDTYANPKGDRKRNE